MRTIEYLIADPAGNITIMVLSPADRKDYAAIAEALLEKHREAEQVAFILRPQDPPAMEMCGLEFCGNASRAFAYYAAGLNEPPLKEITVRVSGTSELLHADLDFEKETAQIEMPLPEGAEEISIQAGESVLSGILVRMDGIAHLVFSDSLQEDPRSVLRLMDAPEEEVRSLFCGIRDDLAGRERKRTGTDFPAFGIMFLDQETGTLRPIVYVRDVDTIYFEGSCASGSAATAYACALQTEETEFRFREPAGELYVSVRRDHGGIAKILLSGSISLSETMTMEMRQD